MHTQIEIYRIIEETLNDSFDNAARLLLSERTPPFTTEEVHFMRGRGAASKQLLAQLRNILGYDPANL